MISVEEAVKIVDKDGTLKDLRIVVCKEYCSFWYFWRIPRLYRNFDRGIDWDHVSGAKYYKEGVPRLMENECIVAKDTGELMHPNFFFWFFTNYAVISYPDISPYLSDNDAKVFRYIYKQREACYTEAMKRKNKKPEKKTPDEVKDCGDYYLVKRTSDWYEEGCWTIDKKTGKKRILTVTDNVHRY